MKIEIVEEKVRHDIWSNEIRLVLSDEVDYNKKVKDVMKVLKKYFKKQYKILKDNMPIEVTGLEV